MPHQAIYLDTAEDTSRFLRSIANVDLIALDTEGASFHRFVERGCLNATGAVTRRRARFALPALRFGAGRRRLMRSRH